MAFSKDQVNTAVGDRKEEVDGYKRTLGNGTVVNVQDHTRTNDAAVAAVVATPGRPPMAAKQGTFPLGRFLPYIWLKPTETPLIEEASETAAKLENNTAKKDDFSHAKDPEKEKSAKKAEKVVNALADLVHEKSKTKGAPGGKK